MTAEDTAVTREPKARNRKKDRLRIPEAVFARHETFAPRYGWLRKGFEAAVADPYVFARDNAPVELGVGKNMARSIRYWTLACGVLKEAHQARGRASAKVLPTGFGKHLFSETGWDPYLEDLGSLWLLHWRLLRRDSMATAWWHAFNELPLAEFSIDDLAASLEGMARMRFPSARLASSSLRKDALCIVQMYSDIVRPQEEREESIRSPFAQLLLLGKGMGARHFAFRVGDKPGLSPALVAALCVDFIGSRSTLASASFSELLRGLGSPGLALRLSEASLYAYLENAVTANPNLSLGDTAGIIQFSVHGHPDAVARSLIDAHFHAAGTSVASS